MIHQTKRLIDSILKHLPAIADGLAFLSGLIEGPKPQAPKRLTAPKRKAKRTR